MTTQQDQLALRDGYARVLGTEPAATLMAMLPQRDELVTKNDLGLLRDDLRSEMTSLRQEIKGEMTSLSQELKGEMTSLRQELRGEMTQLRGEMTQLRSKMSGFIRTFITVQAATVVGVTGIVYALVRLT